MATLAICASALAAAFAPATATAAPPTNILPPTISGGEDPIEGDTLTADAGTWDDLGATFTYQWQRSDDVAPEGFVDINGAVDSTYELVAADVGHTIRVGVIATNADGDSPEVFSEPTDTVGPAPPAPPDNVSRPTISGDAVVGETLTGTLGTWTGDDLTFERQWQRSDDVAPEGFVDINGATAETYVLTAADVGHEVRLAVTASNESDSETALSDPTPTVVAPQNVERSLELFVSRRPNAFKRATIRAEGIAIPGLKLWVYENLRGKGCAETPAERNRRSRLVIDALAVAGDFEEQRRPRMKNPGRHAYCAYLGANENAATMTSFITRKVRKPLLRAPRARETVAVALQRHGFADRVVSNVQQSCARRNRSEFDCRFSSSFPGYRLTGGGSIELKRKLSYRFQVFVRGRSFVLTDENEGGAPG